MVPHAVDCALERRSDPAPAPCQPPPARRRPPRPAWPLQPLPLLWMHLRATACVFPVLVPAASRRRAREYKVSGCGPARRPRHLPASRAVVVIAMAEPAAKKAKTENGIFKKHATCLVLDYGSQVGGRMRLGMREGGGGRAPPSCCRSRPAQRAWGPLCLPERTVGPFESMSMAPRRYACGGRERRRRRPPTAAPSALPRLVCSPSCLLTMPPNRSTHN